MNILLAAASATAILIAGAFALAPTAEIITEVEIDAPLANVWELLGNPAGYGDWNPFIVSMEGELVEGTTLVNTMRPSSGSEMTFRPTVLKVTPERELRWLGRLLLPRIFDGEHYFILEPNGEGTRLVHGERFRGVALWFIDPQQFRVNFEAMNAALKARVEAGATSPAAKS